MMKRRCRSAVLLLLCLLIMAGMAGCGGKTAGYTEVEELNGRRIGTEVGTLFGEDVQRTLPDAKLLYYSLPGDMITALLAEKIDAYTVDVAVAALTCSERDDLTYLSRPVGTHVEGYCFPRNEQGELLQKQMNEFLREQEENGGTAALFDKWMINYSEENDCPDYRDLPDVNGTICAAIGGGYPPFSILAEDRYIGYNLEQVYYFCREYGYALKIENMSYDAVLASLGTHCSMSASGFAYTEERGEMVLFSNPSYTGGPVLVVRKGRESGLSSLWRKLAEGFEKTFLRMDRWKLFLRGIGRTLLITVLSCIFGTVLGFLLYFWCRDGGKLAKAVTGASAWLLHGMPGVVLLMVLYYVIFGRVNAPGIWISILAFTLTFGCGMYKLLLSGLAALDRGQEEAAFTLGYSKNETFFRILLPQAAGHFLPAYRDELVSLVKSTAIVGYIAVEDLTRVSDLVRSYTYDAFFPLFSSVVLYILLEQVLEFFVRRIQWSVDPKKGSRDRFLKGVDRS